LGVGDGSTVSVLVGCDVAVGSGVGERTGGMVAVGTGVSVLVGTGVRVGTGVLVTVGRMIVTCVGAAVTVGNGVAVGRAVLVGAAVAVRTGVLVAKAILVGVRAGVLVATAVLVGVRPGVLVGRAVLVGVLVTVGSEKRRCAGVGETNDCVAGRRAGLDVLTAVGAEAKTSRRVGVAATLAAGGVRVGLAKGCARVAAETRPAECGRTGAASLGLATGPCERGVGVAEARGCPVTGLAVGATGVGTDCWESGAARDVSVSGSRGASAICCCSARAACTMASGWTRAAVTALSLPAMS